MGCGVSAVVLRNAINKNPGIVSVVPSDVTSETVSSMSGAPPYRETAEEGQSGSGPPWEPPPTTNAYLSG